MGARCAWLFTGSTLALLAAAPALAQTAPTDQAAQAPSQVGEVVVTGSRIASTTFTTPTPVTAIGADQLRAAAPSTLAAGLQTLPSIVTQGGPTAGQGTAFGGQNFLNLRGLGANRTLILLNGRRYISSGPFGVVDVNLLPAGLVSRVEVVTGGASAAYGSDAVAGVINFILDTHFEGAKLDASYGESLKYHDSKEYALTGTFGRAFAGGRGHFIANGEYYSNKGVGGGARPFRTNASFLVPNPAGGTPRLISVQDVRVPYTLGGLIVNGAGGSAANNAQLRGLQFGPGGVLQPYSYGTAASDIGVTSGFQSGGDGFQAATGQEILRPLDRETVFARVDYDLTDNVTAFVEGSYGATDTVSQSSPTTRSITIQKDNAFLGLVAPSLVAQMNAIGVPRFTLNRVILERGTTDVTNRNYTSRVVAGLTGDFRGWKWDVAYQWGQNRNKSFVYPNLVPARLALAADAVVNPANGQIVCRSTLTDPGNGCVAFNPFGEGSPSESALDYVMGRSEFRTITKEQFLDGSVSGELFDLPAGPVGLAVGGEWRKQRSVTVADALSNAGGYRLVNAQDYGGEQNVWEVFTEAQVPILKDLAFVRALDLNLAGRHTDYSLSGGVETWKAGLSWQVTDDLRLRGTLSRDIRAPSLNDLFAAGRQTSNPIDDTLNTGQTYFAVLNSAFGNANLDPEKADTTVIGFVYQPSWLPGFNLAVDYWAIRIKDAIASLTPQQTVTQCNLSGQTGPTCAFVTRDPMTRAVIATRTSPVNIAVNKSDGVDIEASYRVPLSDWIGGDPGSLSLRVLASNLRESVVISPLVTNIVNDAGSGDTPHWRGTLTANWERGPYAVTLQARYIGDLKRDPNVKVGVDADFNHVADRAYLDGQLAWRPERFDGRQEFYVNVQNILDRRPAFFPAGNTTPAVTNPNLYDQVGRMFRFGVRLRY
jgi:outer membrane receptor protein involved in Fe transport